MEFGFINALFLFLLIPVLIFVYYKYNTGKKESILKFSTLKVIKQTNTKNNGIRKHSPFVLIILVLSLIIIALANPQIVTMGAEKGINIGIVLDGSESMAASDYNPTRLEAAKKAINSLIEKTPNTNNVGVVVFETGAGTISYLTPVKEKTINSISSIQQGTGATAIGDGLSLGIDMVSSILDKKRVIILLSDGIHNSGLVTPEQATQYAILNNVQVHTIGIGSENPVYLRDDIYGEPQYAELDELALQEIANSTGGMYFKSLDDKTLNEILLELNANLEYEKELSTIRDWFIGSAIIILLIDIYIIYGRFRIAA
ncbi:von Willebrand factor type A domain protein [Candidatus Nitrosomarinus catalina]|uniref:von Willebrand factor type A domain protein n=1 Tax=Candidatus Nitrosomarinus catalinensis TaxID=1898749 RepID=A0A2Z2HNL3_9ARCH|nr:VWA domain-containing protein [Candidatus Nitrosomarinus catalina]ARS64519.1 von Willebrand factor type A domain protein [Candidatus Nitrosomarinus catalina]